MERVLQGLRAAGEPTRLRLLALLDEAELTVSELCQILGQSQPRVSRHLKLLTEAGLLSRVQEGSWAFYRLASEGEDGALAGQIVAMLPRGTPDLDRDRERLRDVQNARARAAAGYFRRVARRWDRVRSLHVPESEVEAALLEAAGHRHAACLLDLGTGTGRILQVFAPRIEQGLGVDLSREMLAVARHNLTRAGLGHCRVRHGDIYRLDLPAGSVDLVTVHHVLHFLHDPALAISESARALRPGGRMLIVDFAPHELEFLRSEYAHRRLGFAEEEVSAWCRAAGLTNLRARQLRGAATAGSPDLTVTLWSAEQRADAPSHHRLEVA